MTTYTTNEIVNRLTIIYHETTAVLRRDGLATKAQIGSVHDFPFDKLIPKWKLLEKIYASDFDRFIKCLMKEWVFKLAIGGGVVHMSHIPMELLSVYEVRARKTLLKQYRSEFISVWGQLFKRRADHSWIDLNCRTYERYIDIAFNTEPIPERWYAEHGSATWETFQKLTRWVDWLQTNYPYVLEEQIPGTSNLNPVLLIELYDQYVDSM